MLTLLVLLGWSTAQAAPEGSTSTSTLTEATRLLSRYAPGQMPRDPSVAQALHTLHEQGTRDEISLLRNLADNEHTEVAAPAMAAIGAIRDRQVLEQRDAFAATLPNWPDLNQHATPMRKRHQFGREEARCAAYAEIVLGERKVQVAPVQGDPWELLERGKPRKALGAATLLPTTAARLAEGRAREELGDISGALQEYAYLAASGNLEARARIDGFGVDYERVLLGILVNPESPLPREEGEVLDVLVRTGGDLTVDVLAERARRVDDTAVRAANALARMLDDGEREAAMAPSSRRFARRALAIVARRDDAAGLVATEALAGN